MHVVEIKNNAEDWVFHSEYSSYLKATEQADLVHGRVVWSQCCIKARRTGDWEERAGGALHCPDCGTMIAYFRQ